jgi:hypothetical protein
MLASKHMAEEEYIEEDAPQEDVSVEESDEELVDSDAMSGAEGGFSQGAESDMDLFEDEEKAQYALDDDERLED